MLILNKVSFREEALREAVLGVPVGEARSYSAFVKSAWKLKKVRVSRVKKHDGLVVTVGPLNYAEREFRKKNPKLLARSVMGK